MLSPGWETVRLFLHVLGAAVWVGGQITLGGLVPRLRGVGPDATSAAARGFARLAWPAYLLLVGTGVWNVVAVHAFSKKGGYDVTTQVKIGVVLLAGISAYAHQRATSRQGLAVWGALSGLSSLAALFLGVLLAQ
ncbi:MAG TPA: hypothetical protein VFH45_12710 [Acidimicrobiales bacterium]|nr:hypothetical protein [Acidimicrobiales bacterium]